MNVAVTWSIPRLKRFVIGALALVIVTACELSLIHI